MRKCPNCGNALLADGRFCPECGRPLAGETGVSPGRAWWPPDPVSLVAALFAIGAIILLAGGEWAWGLVVLLAAAVVFLAGREAERRLAGRALRNFRVRFSATREAMAARSRGQLELFRARRERAELEAEKARGFHQLGQAVFDDDEAGIRATRTALDGIVERIGRKEAEIEMLMRETEERVQRAQAQASPTQRLEAPPEPPRIPEPWPPPDEGTPPTPEPVPEPRPDPVPEPSPDEAAEPQTRGRKK